MDANGRVRGHGEGRVVDFGARESLWTAESSELGDGGGGGVEGHVGEGVYGGRGPHRVRGKGGTK